MDIHTIADAFQSDLRARFIFDSPIPFDEKSIRLQDEVEEIVSPRLVILCGDPKRFAQMDGTARVPVSIEFSTSLDRVDLDDHRATAGKLQEWWVSLRAFKKVNAAFARCYLHDLLIAPPSTIERARNKEREQVTTVRADAVVTLYEEPQLI